MKHPIVRLALSLFTVSLLLAVYPRPAHAAVWANPAGGLFALDLNWEAGVLPGPSDQAIFGSVSDTNPYTVTITGQTNKDCHVDDGNVTFNLSGQTYTLTSKLDVGSIPTSAAPPAAQLTLVHGSVASHDVLIGRIRPVPSAGPDSPSTGVLTVSSHASLNATGDLLVGHDGTGTLSVENGGFVSGAASVIVGNETTALGTLAVTGDDSMLQILGASALRVGNRGIGSMTISNRGRVISGSGVVGDLAGSEGRVAVADSDSLWFTYGQDLTIGDAGRGELAITNGGEVGSGTSVLGTLAGAVGVATVSGDGSRWVTRELVVGVGGDGFLTISSGGRVQSDSAPLGGLAGTGDVIVTGAGSQWAISGALNTGIGSGFIDILDGGSVTAGTTTLSTGADSLSTLTVDGVGSSFNASGKLVIGSAGDAVTSIRAGATGSSAGMVQLGATAGSYGLLRVTGSGSTFDAAGGVFIGGTDIAAGGDADLLVEAGGTLDASGATVKIWSTPGTSVTLNGGTINAGSFERLGTFDFKSGTLHVSGGTFDNGTASLLLDGAEASDLPILRLSDNANTRFISSSFIGDARQGRLEVLSGSDLTQTGPNALIGRLAGSSGSALVSGPGSSWTHPGDFIVGGAGTGRLDISNQASVTSSSADIALTFTGNGSVTVDNATWNQSGTMTVGVVGRASLAIQNGGWVTTNLASTLGSGPSGSGVVSITGPGSRWTINSSVVIGNQGTGTLTIADGGSMSSTDATIAAANAANTTSTAALDGANSLWTVNGSLHVGLGGRGELTVARGARLESSKATLGTTNGGNGAATISGPGSTWNNSSTLFVGGNVASPGGPSTLVVENGGTLNVGTVTADTFKVWNGSTLVLDGGTINTRRFERLGTFNFADGLFNVTGALFSSSGPFTLDGLNDDDLPTLRLAGGATTAGVTTLVVGSTRRGALEITGGSVLTSIDGLIGSAAGSTGSATLTGGGTTWSLTGSLSVGGTDGGPGGAGMLTIGNGALVSLPAGKLYFWPDGVVNLNGGTITLQTFIAEGGAFNFNSGTVAFSGAVTADESLLTALLGATHSLTAARTLSAATMTLVAPLSVDGGVLSTASLSAGSTLQISTGSARISNTAMVEPAGLLRISNTGLFDVVNTLTNNGQIELAANTATLNAGMLVNNGVLSGRGRVNAQLVNNVDGGLRAENAERLIVLGPPNIASTNAGRIEAASGGTIEFQQPLENSATTGLVAAENGTLRFHGGLTNNGSLAISFGTSRVFGEIDNAASGRIVVSGGAQATFYDDIANSGTINVSAAGGLQGTAVFLGALSGSGVSGGGHVFLEGDARPGFSPGTMAFGGDLSFGPLSTLLIELGGTAPGAQYDRVAVADTAELGGTLDVDLINGFVPVGGNSFELMTYASHGGTFDTVLLPTLPDGLDWMLDYGGTNLTLSVTSTRLPGDIDLDGDVDRVDAALFTPHLGTAAGSFWAIGDFDGDAATTLDDFNLLQANIGRSLGPSPAANAVPEPAACLLALAAVTAFGLRRRGLLPAKKRRRGATAGLSSSAIRAGVPLLACPAVRFARNTPAQTSPKRV